MSYHYGDCFSLNVFIYVTDEDYILNDNNDIPFKVGGMERTGNAASPPESNWPPGRLVYYLCFHLTVLIFCISRFLIIKSCDSVES